VATPVDLIEVHEVGVRLLHPAERSLEDLAGERCEAHGERDRGASSAGRESGGALVFPVRPRRRGPGACQPIQGDVVDDPVPSEIASRVVVDERSPGFIADTDDEAKELFWPRYRVIRDRIGALRGWPPIRRQEFDAEVEGGSLYIGSPETVARKIARPVTELGVGRFDLIYTAGSQPIGARLRAVELYGKTVIPMVRDLIAC